MLLNLAVFLVQLALPVDLANHLLYAGGAIPWEIIRLTDLTEGMYQVHALLPPPLTILSAMFLHGSLEHIAGNLWFLWVFGRAVEESMGVVRFVLFYLLGGVCAALVQVAMTPTAVTPMVGASGAIAAVLGAYLVLHPTARLEVLLFLVVFVQFVVVPAGVALGVWLLWQVIGNRGSLSVAAWAHIGGFVVGAAMCKLFRRARPAVNPTTASAKLVPPWTLRTAAGSSSLPR